MPRMSLLRPHRAALRPVIHNASRIIARARVDIRDNFGDTNMRFRNIAQGRDLANSLGENSVVLMRGHGLADHFEQIPAGGGKAVAAHQHHAIFSQ